MYMLIIMQEVEMGGMEERELLFFKVLSLLWGSGASPRKG